MTAKTPSLSLNRTLAAQTGPSGRPPTEQGKTIDEGKTLRIKGYLLVTPQLMFIER